jgi:hypothetical protein
VQNRQIKHLEEELLKYKKTDFENSSQKKVIEKLKKKTAEQV